jgi:hypothetical protein
MRLEGSTVIEVEDTGMGIPEEAIPRVFESFYTTKARGLGLGLVYCKRAWRLTRETSPSGQFREWEPDSLSRCLRPLSEISSGISCWGSSIMRI